MSLQAGQIGDWTLLVVATLSLSMRYIVLLFQCVNHNGPIKVMGANPDFSH
jgi:hypothetical protein